MRHPKSFVGLIMMMLLMAGCKKPDQRLVELSSRANEQQGEHDKLEAERKKLAEERRTAPLVAAAITSVSLIVSCLLPLVICAALLWPSRSIPQAEGLVELLVDELASPLPQLSVPTPPARLPAAPSVPRME